MVPYKNACVNNNNNSRSNNRNHNKFEFSTFFCKTIFSKLHICFSMQSDKELFDAINFEKNTNRKNRQSNENLIWDRIPYKKLIFGHGTHCSWQCVLFISKNYIRYFNIINIRIWNWICVLQNWRVDGKLWIYFFPENSQNAVLNNHSKTIFFFLDASKVMS